MNAINSTVITPNLIGANLFFVKGYIEDAGLKVGTITYEEKEYAHNIVFFQSIAPGEEVSAGKKINIKVSGRNPIRFLPSMYQNADIKNGDFLKRYLWIFYDILNSINNKLDHIDRYFNPLEAPTEFFKWLASWFSISLDYAIPEHKMRLLVKEAVNLYRWRGTAVGISKFLEIITGIKPEIIDHDIPINEYVITDNKQVERHIVEEINTPYNFTVYFPVKVDHFDLETIKKIHQIIKSEKPAHSHYYVLFAQDEEEVRQHHATIGVDRIT